MTPVVRVTPVESKEVTASASKRLELVRNTDPGGRIERDSLELVPESPFAKTNKNLSPLAGKEVALNHNDRDPPDTFRRSPKEEDSVADWLLASTKFTAIR